MTLTLSFHQKFKAVISSSEQLAGSSPLFQSEMVRLILSKENNAAPENRIEPFFGPHRVPGTSSIGLRKGFPELFQDTLKDRVETYDNWLNRIVTRTLMRMKNGSPVASATALSGEFREEVTEKVRIILEFRDNRGHPLCELIPQQMYEDVFIRMIMMITEKDTSPDEPYLYETFNKICHRLAMSLISCLDANGTLRPTDSGIRQLIHISVLSGYVGINLKSSASAASALLNQDLIPIEKTWIKDMNSVHAVSRDELDQVSKMMISLSSASGERFGLDSMDRYFQEVVDAEEPTLLVFFSDDYMESLVDLKRFEIMMQRNHQLYLLFVPRNGRYGNDFACDDLPDVLDDPVFAKLSLLRREGRFLVSSAGPMAGCMDVRHISEALIEQIEGLSRGKFLVFETKGCRNFEMLRGSLSAPWYTSFNCNRALSIRTVGIDMEPVFLRIPPGLTAYDGFTKPRVGATPSGRSQYVKFARMTTRDLYEALESKPYLELLRKSGNEFSVNCSLMEKCIQKKMTFPELLNTQ
ncbi:hypothetical protein [Desulfonema magnum]|uniref:Uncharacterized protein n=1 Tax=Desulfonema magnum TaxID=45655 RepID=A0A975GQ97_9BACT|nr:hypothetical protein [Desulfonema magnum]QTA89654.1 Uncharacterized protein dnm_057110 [Desulfonema magnum]